MQEILAASGVTHPARAQLIRRVSELHNDISGVFYGKYVGASLKGGMGVWIAKPQEIEFKWENNLINFCNIYNMQQNHIIVRLNIASQYLRAMESISVFRLGVLLSKCL